MKRQSLKAVAADLEMVIIAIPRRKRDDIWQHLAVNLDRLRPIGFDGHAVICRSEDEIEFRGVVSGERLK